MSRFTKRMIAGVLVASGVLGVGATSADADKGGGPNPKACWGQFVRAGAQVGPSAPGVGGFVSSLAPQGVDDFVRFVKAGGEPFPNEVPCPTDG